MLVFRYDKSFDGLLSALFDAYAMRAFPEQLIGPGEPEPLFTERVHEVATDPAHAARVWRGLERRLVVRARSMLVYAWHGEQERSDLLMLRCMCRVFDEGGGVLADQADPDMYVHVVERRADGIVVCGAKCHQTGSINSHWHIFMPTISMGEADKDWAVSFACPTDAEGMYMIYGRQSCDTRKMEENASIDVGNAKFGGQEALVVLDHVFIPNEYIFLNGEYEFAGMMVERFAGYHRQSYGGCKVGVGDTLIGAAALAAEYNGVEKASAVKDKLIEMTHLNETLYCCGIACSAEGHPTDSGNYIIDLLLANVCKQNVTRFPYEIARLAEDIAGGLMVTAPSEADLRDEKLGAYVEKYLKGVSGVSTENRLRILRLIENLTLGTAAVGYRTESLHGAGSPQAQRIMIARQGNLQHKKELAKTIAHIKE